MRIFDSEGKRVLDRVTLFLTPEEATELAQTAADLAANPSKHHNHVFDVAYVTEITVAVHTNENIHSFDDISRSVIERGVVSES